MNPEYVERMHGIIDLCLEPYDPKRPKVGIDEKSLQLLKDTREPIPIKPGSSGKYDYEYKRNKTANIFVAVEPDAGRRKTKATKNRKKDDFAHFVKELVDEDYKDAELVRIILDNLNTHFESSFYETFGKEEAERILSKIEFHYTPKHGSWLNVAELEINVMQSQCTGRRMKDMEFLVKELKAWTKRRNDEKRKINWRFTKEKADEKLGRHYVA